MPIRLTCPSCAATLTVPDASAGKTGKCPKCQAPVKVPAPAPQFEVVDEPVAPPSSPRPAPVAAGRPSPRQRSADDAPDDRLRGRNRNTEDRDEDDRPRGRRRDRDDRDEVDDRPAGRRPARGRKKAGGNKTVLVLAAVGVAVLLLAAGGVAAWVLIEKAPPTEWSRFDEPEGLFTVYFPGGAGGPVDLVETAAGKSSPRTQRWTQRFNGRSYVAVLMSWEPQLAEAANPEIVARIGGNKMYTAEALTTLSGRKAVRRFTTVGGLGQASVSAGLGNGRSVIFTVIGDEELTFDDPMVVQFFARVELKAGLTAFGRTPLSDDNLVAARFFDSAKIK